MRLQTPDKIRDLQRGLYLKAKREPKFRFYLLNDKVWREDILRHAYRLERSNGGAPGIDGVTFQSVENGEGEAKFLSKLQQELKEKTYRAQPVRRVFIPKADGKKRPLGIPTIRDRVAQMADAQVPAEAATDQGVWLSAVAGVSALSRVGAVRHTGPCSVWAHSHALR